MIEAGANIVSDEVMYNGIMAGHEANQKIIEFIKGIKAEIGKPKFSYPSNEPDEEMLSAVKAFATEDVKLALDTDDKSVRDARLKPIYEKVHEKFDAIYPDQAAKIDECMNRMNQIMDTLRGHAPEEIAGYEVIGWSDYEASQRCDGGKKSEITLPKSNVLEYRLGNGSKLIVRPSGTEPKIKVYLSGKGDDKAASMEIIEKLRSAAPKLLGI